MECTDNEELMHHPQIDDNVIHPADFKPLGLDEGDVGDNESINKALAEVRDRFYAGAPMFTKKAIRDLDEQLKTLKDQESNVYVKGVYDQIVRFEVETGKVTTVGGELEIICECMV